MRSSSHLSLLLVFALGCGGPPRASFDPDEGIGSNALAAPTPGAIELALRRADGSFVDIGDLRGERVLLFLFATFDTVSQMQLTPLRDLVEADGELRVYGIAAQPGARLLVDAYEHALTPPFPITYDPEETVSSGGSALGAIEAVPTLIVLDRRGVVVARHQGFADFERLRALVEAAGR